MLLTSGQHPFERVVAHELVVIKACPYQKLNPDLNFYAEYKVGLANVVVPSEKQIVYSIAGIMNMIYAAIRVYR